MENNLETSETGEWLGDGPGYSRTRNRPVSNKRPLDNAIVVDAECDQSTGMCSYRGKYLGSQKMLFEMGRFEGGTNNIVEFLAVVHALALCKRNGLTHVVYTDSQTAMAWVKKKYVNTTVEWTDKNEPLRVLVKRGLNWLHDNPMHNTVLKWETKVWGENPADYGYKR